MLKITVFNLQTASQYLITAKHLFESLAYPATAEIELLLRGGYTRKKASIYYHNNKDIDIAIIQITPHEPITQQYGNANTSVGISLGQDVYFLGFPYSFDETLIENTGHGVPMPFVKKACMSGYAIKNGSKWLVLDGHNNLGFSGGPICFQPLVGGPMSICGVVSGYFPELKPVIDQIGNTVQIVDGSGNTLPLSVQENTGIIWGCDIVYATEIIQNISHKPASGP